MGVFTHFARVLSFCLVAAGTGARKLPDYVSTCPKNHPEPEKCLIDSIIQLKPYLLKGIPEMGIPPIDPMKIKEMSFSSGAGSSYSFEANMTDLTFYGCRDMEPLAAKVDRAEKAVEMTVRVPMLYVTGKYVSKGTVMMLTFDGRGPMSLNFTNVLMKAKLYGTSTKIKGKEHYKFEKQDVKVDVGKVAGRFEDLFEGNPELTDAANASFNENSDVLYEELKPLISATLSKFMLSIFNGVHARFSNDVLYAD